MKDYQYRIKNNVGVLYTDIEGVEIFISECREMGFPDKDIYRLIEIRTEDNEFIPFKINLVNS